MSKIHKQNNYALALAAFGPAVTSSPSLGTEARAGKNVKESRKRTENPIKCNTLL